MCQLHNVVRALVILAAQILRNKKYRYVDGFMVKCFVEFSNENALNDYLIFLNSYTIQ